MNRKRSKTLVCSAIYLLLATVIAVQELEMKEGKRYYIVYAAAASTLSSDFNFAAAGDWACTSDTTDTVNNILDKSPELVLGLGDYSYEDSADCWLDIIQPIDNIMKIAIGNHEVEEQSILAEYMNRFGLTSQYYSFDYQNVHFIALATESGYHDMSTDKAKEQLAFVKSDLEKASANPNIKWIIPFFHRMMYYEEHASCSILGEHDNSLVDIYHPLFEKYGVHLVLQAHSHTYERTYPLKANSEENSSKDPLVTSNDLSDYPSIDGLVIATVGTGGRSSCQYIHTDPKLAPIQYENLFGFLNVNVSSDGRKLVGTFYDNDVMIKDRFMIAK
ncbi:MAG TPA: metallophosphoesterase [Nitrososphaeraceae archaeon]|nr:metallophosphoesterase [Nitrososphaeraceae archaeon]